MDWAYNEIIFLSFKYNLLAYKNEIIIEWFPCEEFMYPAMSWLSLRSSDLKCFNGWLHSRITTNYQYIPIFGHVVFFSWLSPPGLNWVSFNVSWHVKFQNLFFLKTMWDPHSNQTNESHQIFVSPTNSRIILSFPSLPLIIPIHLLLTTCGMIFMCMTQYMGGIWRWKM